MEKHVLSMVEHSYYKAGEVGGAASATDSAAKDLRAAAIHYKGQGDAETAIPVTALIDTLNKIAEQLEKAAGEHRKEFQKRIGQALRLSAKDRSLVSRARVAAKAALSSWRGQS